MENKRSKYSAPHWYPAWVYDIRIDVTRRNMELYDRQQEQIDKLCHELAPDWKDLDLRSRYEIRRTAREKLGYT